jgi:AcrR family transcriptional regulator
LFVSDLGHADPGDPDPADHTAARLVAAAERLFAQGGEEATSLRAITREARSNAAAVHYHFGGRDELLRALVDQHLGPLSVLRERLLAQAAADYGEPLPVAAVVEALVRPDLELLAALRTERIQVARFLGRAQTLSSPALARQVESRFDALAGLALPRLRQSLPDIGEDELRSRLRLVTAAVSYLFATATATDPDRPGALGTEDGSEDGTEDGTGDGDEQVRRLVAFGVGGLSAPATATATATVTRTVAAPPERARARTVAAPPARPVAAPPERTAVAPRERTQSVRRKPAPPRPTTSETETGVKRRGAKADTKTGRGRNRVENVEKIEKADKGEKKRRKR